MAKGKRSPALFEIINRAQTQGENPHLQIPGWWRNLSEAAQMEKNLNPKPAHEPASAESDVDRENYDRVAEAVEEVAAQAEQAALEQDTWVSELPQPEPEPEPESEPEPEPEIQVIDAAEDPPVVDDGQPPRPSLLTSIRTAMSGMLRIEHGRLEVGLSPLGSVIGGCMLLLALAISFAWGYAAGNLAGMEQARVEILAEASDSVEEARRLAPDHTVLDLSTQSDTVVPNRPAGKAPGAPVKASVHSAGRADPPTAAGGVRKIGWNYLVVQNFRGEDSREEAARAERFLAGNMPLVDGQPVVTIEVRPEGTYYLLSTMGYAPGDNRQREALERFREQITQVGKLYRQQGGGYDFSSAYPMRLSHLPSRRK